MARRTPTFRAPNQWLRSGTWPDGEFAEDAPEAVGVAVGIAVALAAAVEGRNKSEIAAAADIERSTLYDILAGNTWPDSFTLAKLQVYLGAPLWPTELPPPIRRES